MHRKKAAPKPPAAPVDRHLEYLRSELRSAQMREECLMAEMRGERLRAEVMAKVGTPRDVADLAEIAEGGAAVRADALRRNGENQATWRRMIAEHLAKATERVQTIRATSDDAALFELLASVGGRMPEAGAR